MYSRFSSSRLILRAETNLYFILFYQLISRFSFRDDGGICKRCLATYACNVGHVETTAVHEKEPLMLLLLLFIMLFGLFCHFDHIQLRCFSWKISVLLL